MHGFGHVSTATSRPPTPPRVKVIRARFQTTALMEPEVSNIHANPFSDLTQPPEITSRHPRAEGYGEPENPTLHIKISHKRAAHSPDAQPHQLKTNILIRSCSST